MVGRAVSLFPKVAAPIGEVLLEVNGLTRVGVFHDVSFSVRAGEIVGLRRPGRRGADGDRPRPVRDRPARRREVELAGEAVAFSSPSAAMNAGIAYLPEDRHQEGLVLDFSIAQNVTLPILPRMFPRFLIAARPSGRSPATTPIGSTCG